MDPITSNFVINITGISVAAVVAVIGAFSKCFTKSRCTSIKSPCLSCERDPIDADSEIYKDSSDDSFVVPQTNMMMNKK